MRKTSSIEARIPLKASHIVFTDGSWLQKESNKPGGWAAVIVELGKAHEEISGAEANTTNNRMEMTAIISALEFISGAGGTAKEDLEVVVFTDSQYVSKYFQYIPQWKSDDWQRWVKDDDGDYIQADVLNRDLWEKLDALGETLNFQLEWIGRSTHPLNKRCDQLAGQMAKSLTS